MSKWEKTNLWLKQHYLCVIAWLVVVLIALIVVMAGNDKELVGYFSFACSLSGILLAIVVIIHTWIDSSDTRTVLTEVKSHLTDIRGDVGKTAEILQSDMVQNLFGREQQIDSSRRVTEQSIQSSQAENFPFSFSNLRLFPLLVLYAADKIFQSGKAVNMEDYLRYIFPNELAKFSDDNSKALLISKMLTAYFGILLMFEGFIGLEEIKVKMPIIEVNTFPSNIQGKVESELSRKLQLSSTYPKYIEDVRRWKNLTDAYFTNLSITKTT